MGKGKKQLYLNMGTSILAFFVNTGIQFFITPILSKNIGDEAYGFITIANDFTSYASIIAVVLNSVASRFISVEIHKGNTDKAEEYYSSIFVGNIIISVVLSLLGCYVTFRFDKFLVISHELIRDVSFLFAITFSNYILSVMISLLTISVYVKNRLDILAIRNIVSYIIKLVVVVLLFSLSSKIKVYYLAIASFTSTIFLGFANARISKRIMPEIRIRKNRFRIKTIFTLLKTGSWMTINNLANVISSNLTTIIINMNISAKVAGFYSIALTIPNAANSFIYAIYSVFVPTYYKLYAEKKKIELINYGIHSMKMMAFIVSVPIIVLCIKSIDFLTLWQSYRSDTEIGLMSSIFIISLLLCLSYASVLSISQLGLVANNIKLQMIVNIVVSFLVLFITLYIVKFTNFGITGISLASLIIQGLKWLIFTPLFAAYVIGAPRFVFLIHNFRIILSELVTGGVVFLISMVFKSNTWISLILSSILLCLIGYAVLFFVLYRKEERSNITFSIKDLILNNRESGA